MNTLRGLDKDRKLVFAIGHTVISRAEVTPATVNFMTRPYDQEDWVAGVFGDGLMGMDEVKDTMEKLDKELTGLMQEYPYEHPVANPAVLNLLRVRGGLYSLTISQLEGVPVVYIENGDEVYG